MNLELNLCETSLSFVNFMRTKFAFGSRSPVVFRSTIVHPEQTNSHISQSEPSRLYRFFNFAVAVDYIRMQAVITDE